MSTDYTPIGPVPSGIANGTVDATSRQLARDMRGKAYGKDVRETIARMTEWHSIRTSASEVLAAQSAADAKQSAQEVTQNAQSALKLFNDAVRQQTKKIDNMVVDFTDYDFDSAPEIVAARRGKASLGVKIDDVEAQLAQTESQLNSRMDTVISLSEGSTTNDARLEDIAVGVTGKVYDSPGTAVRNVEKSVRQITKTINRFDKDSVINGRAIDLGDGTIPPLEGWSVSESIYIGDLETIKFYLENGISPARTLFYGLYDKENNYISGKNLTSEVGSVVTRPTNVFSVKVAMQNDLLSEAMVLDHEEYLKDQDYEPYGKLYIDEDSLSTVRKIEDTVRQITKTINRFDKDSVINGRFIDMADGTTPLLEGWSVSESIYIGDIGEVKFYLKNGISPARPFFYGFYDKENNYISGKNLTSEENSVVTRPTNAFGVKVAMQNHLLSEAMVLDHEEYLKDQTYEPYGRLYLNENSFRDAETVKEITLTVGEGKEYAKFEDALQHANSINGVEKVIIEVDEGTYNVFEGMTQEDMSGFIGLRIGNVEVHGTGRPEHTIIRGYLPDTITKAARDKVSTFNIMQSVYFRNITIYGENIRYTIHDDYPSINDGFVTYENCIIEGKSLTFGGSYGAGTWNDVDYTFNKVKFISRGYNSAGGFHNILNEEDYYAPSRIVFEDCIFDVDNNKTLDFGTLSDTKNFVYFKGCTFSGFVAMNIGNGMTKSAWQISGSGNGNVQLHDNTPDKNAYFKFSDQVVKKINRSTEPIEKYKAVKLSNNDYYRVEKATDANTFFGVALEDIPSGKTGYVLVSGALPNNALDFYQGHKLTVDNTGSLVIGTTDTVAKCIRDGVVVLS